MRALLAVDLWEISIVTFPLLAGARVHAVKDASSRRPSFAPTRAEAEWRAVVAGEGAAPAASPRPLAPPRIERLRRRRAG